MKTLEHVDHARETCKLCKTNMLCRGTCMVIYIATVDKHIPTFFNEKHEKNMLKTCILKMCGYICICIYNMYIKICRQRPQTCIPNKHANMHTRLSRPIRPFWNESSHMGS